MYLPFRPFALALSLFLGALAAVQAAPIVLIDMQGQRIDLAGPVERVVTIPMPASSLFMTLDQDSRRLAAMHPNAHALLRDSLLSRIFPAAAAIRHDVTRSGFAPNVETLLAIQPDLVWQWGHLGEELLTPIRAAGLPVAALMYGNEERARTWIRLMGDSLGKPDRAAALLGWREQTEGAIRRVTESIPAAQRPRVLYLSRVFPEFRAPGRESNFSFDIALAGGVSVSDLGGSGRAINAEQLLQWDPEIILLNNFEPALTPQTIYDNPLLADVKAVRARRVYKLPAGGYVWDPPSQESPLYWQWLSMIVQPERFDWPLRANLAEAYRMLYRYSPTPDDIDAVLRIRDNQAAKGYERFR